MKILIVDDEKPARDRLARMVGEINTHELVGEAVNGLEALGLAQSLEPDIVLLDIRMPGMDGIEAARHIAKLDEPPAVIFTTAFSDHALEAFETHAVDYLLKPVKLERLQAALDATIRPTRAQASRSGDVLSELEPRQHICARVRGSLVLVPIEKIYYFHAEQKYVTVRHEEGEVLIEDPLKALEPSLESAFIVFIETRWSACRDWPECNPKMTATRSPFVISTTCSRLVAGTCPVFAKSSGTCNPT